MPSTVVSSRLNSARRQRHKYRIPDAAKSRAREQRKIEKQRRMAQNKSNKNKGH